MDKELSEEEEESIQEWVVKTKENKQEMMNRKNVKKGRTTVQKVKTKQKETR